MGTVIPLGDVSRRARGFAWVTALIIAANAFVFLLELEGGEAFVKRWAVIPVRIEHGHHLITIVTAMFMHAGWLHILGNMVFLWAFGPAIEDAMGRFRYIVFYLAGAWWRCWRRWREARVDGSLPGRERSDCGGDGRVHCDFIRATGFERWCGS